MVVVDVPLGLLLWAGFHWHFATPLLAIAPRWARHRLVALIRTPRLTAGVAVSVLIGAITHVGRDSFTHGHGWPLPECSRRQRYSRC
ncbi:MAG: DUF4184 family protein [Actinomycetota bacterium]|nr:DUF4184 family protein [Actinomycetota bacterium]